MIPLQQSVTLDLKKKKKKMYDDVQALVQDAIISDIEGWVNVQLFWTTNALFAQFACLIIPHSVPSLTIGWAPLNDVTEIDFKNECVYSRADIKKLVLKVAV